MKKISILIFILNLSFLSQAQDFKGGVILGLSTSQLSGDHLEGFNKAGLILGAFTSRVFSEKISGKMELIYIQKGSKNPDLDTYNNEILHLDISRKLLNHIKCFQHLLWFQKSVTCLLL